ncbi:MAG: outer membrane beta-barrel protein [Bryobacteraceae bacterium]
MQFLFALSAMLIAFPAAAQTTGADAQAPVTAPAAPLKYRGWVFSVSADGYITYNGNRPASGANQLYNFNTQEGQPELSLAKIVLDKSDAVLGLHLDLGFGETLRLMHSGDPAAIDHKALRYIEQAYAIVKPKHTHGTEFDFGQFNSSAGAEVVESNSNWNYSRSLLYAWAIPYYEFGFRSNVPITKEFSAGFQLVNAWNTVWGNNDLNNIGITTALTRPRYTWSVNYYEGPNHMGTTAGKRGVIDTTVLFTPNGKLNAYVNFDYGQDNRVGPAARHDNWAGIAGAARYQLTGKMACAARLEWFGDQTGFATSLAQNLKEATMTGEYKHNNHLLTRLEFRHDWSDKPFYERGSGEAAKTYQDTLTLGVVVSAGPYK